VGMTEKNAGMTRKVRERQERCENDASSRHPRESEGPGL